MRARWTRPAAYAASAGILAAALTLGVAELVAAAVHPRSSPLVAVGTAFIAVTPTWLKDFAVGLFGTYDKVALIVGMLLVITALAAGVGRLARAHPGSGVAGVALLGLAGAVAAITREDASWVWALPAVLGAAAGASVLTWLTRASQAGFGGAGTGADVEAAKVPEVGASAARDADPAEPAEGRASEQERTLHHPDRRRFLLAGAGVATAAGLAGSAGRALSGWRFAAASSRAGVRLPRPDSPAPTVPSGADLGLADVPPFFTPNEGFYRIDTVLALPQVPYEEWSLRIHGMVDKDIELSYRELLEYPVIERDITLACVSNPVGGSYVGNARWLGVRLADVLRDAGVHPDADQVFSRSSDGWTCGTPTEVVMDGRDAMLAVGMSGKPLPVLHGFPVRMVVPGLFGFVSATKWLVDIELTRFADKKAYWAKRGWASKAPVETMSRIDTPAPTAAVTAGRVPIAGVAWAQHRGIERVEVRVDEGAWQQARLAPVPNKDTWRQWVYYWDATPGDHKLQVRATDGRGRTQSRWRTPPTPNGATGWHTVPVTVS